MQDRPSTDVSLTIVPVVDKKNSRWAIVRSGGSPRKECSPGVVLRRCSGVEDRRKIVVRGGGERAPRGAAGR